VKDQPASTLSGGEQRRLALARALAPESDILYLDEAFRELDEKNETTAIELVRQVAQEKPILLASHDHGLVERLNASVVMISKQPRCV
jgi:ABC-type Mn2+/Zn2+ transport system ATPase subunit